MVFLLAITPIGVVAAHATLIRSDPPNGGRLGVPPARIVLEFNEAVAARTSRVELVAPDSQRFSLSLSADSAQPKILVAAAPPLVTTGSYRVEWRLIGPDGHAVTGRVGFVIDSVPVAAPDTARIIPLVQHDRHDPSADTLGQQAIRFASSASLVIAIGAIAFALFVLPSVDRAGAATPPGYSAIVDGRLKSFATAAGWSLLALAAIRLVSHATTLSGSMNELRVGDLTDLISGSTFGRGWMLMVIAAGVLLVALRSTPATRWRLAAAAAVGLATAAAMLGHPAAVPDAQRIAIGVDATHALAAGGWAGGIFVLAVVAFPEAMRARGDERLTLARSLLRAFSPMALACAAVLLVTGAVSAWLQLRDIGLLLNSAYGLALVRKVVAVLVIAALGAYHWRVAQPSLDSDRSVSRLRTSLALDVMLVVAVLVLTAILTGTAPPVR